MKIAKYFKPLPRLRLLFFCIVIYSIFITTVQANESLFGRPVAEFEVLGNKITQARFVIRWSRIEIGQSLNQEMLDLARQRIMNKELFKEVTVNAVASGDKVRIVITLVEKRYTLLLPRLSRNSDGDIKVGLQLSMDNLNGGDQSLRLLAERGEASTGEESSRYRIGYRIPQYSRPYEYFVAFGQEIANTEDVATGFTNEVYNDFISFSVSRKWYVSSLPRQLKLFTGFTYQRVDLREPYPEELGGLEPGNYNRINLNLEYDGINYEIYRRTGRHYFFTYQQGLEALGSDFDSSLFEMDARFYQPINDLDNFNYRLFTGLSHNTPFNSQNYNIGSSKTIRGIDRGSFSGDALLFGNFEYIKGFKKYRKFRTSAFIDIGNVYEDVKSIDITDLRVGIGVGLRWKAVSFVRTDLVVDVGYDIDTGNVKFYAGTRLNF
ncbi:MAG: BamA/TamA family outer membrane protein [Gammaproteobacteria bacterium]